MSQKKLCNLVVTPHQRYLERGLTIVVLCIDIRAMLKQQA